MKYSEFEVDELRGSLLVKACPFCGNVDLEIQSESTYYELLGRYGNICTSINCRRCNAVKYYHHCKTGDRCGENMRKSIRDWNRRVEDEI